MASDSLLSVIAGLVKSEDREAKKLDKKLKEKLKAKAEKEAKDKPDAPFVDDEEEDEDEAPVGDQDNPETEPEPEAETEPEAEPEPETETEPEPEEEPDDGAGDTKPSGPDPILVQQVTDAVMGHITTMMKDAEEAQKEIKNKETKLDGKSPKIDTKPKMEQRHIRRSFREAVESSTKKKDLNEEEVEVTESTSDWIGGLAAVGGGYLLKKAWDQWGKGSKAKKAKKVIDKQKDKDDADADIKQAGEIKTKNKQQKADSKNVGKDGGMDPDEYYKKYDKAPKGYNYHEPSGKVLSIKDIKKMNAKPKAGLGGVKSPSEKGAGNIAKLGKKGAGTAGFKKLQKNDFYHFIKHLKPLPEEERIVILNDLILEETMTINESNELQAIMALDDVGISAEINRKGEVVIKKKDLKKAEKALKTSFKKGGQPKLRVEGLNRSEMAFNKIRKVRNKLTETVDRAAADDLSLYIKDEVTLQKQKNSIIKSIIGKKSSDTYDHTKAPALWDLLVVAGAKSYVKEFGGDVDTLFPREVRQTVAVQFANEYNAEIESGTYN
jgi:hypothetical protein